MPLDLTPRGRDMVIGALVADAASMGLHWIYDQDRISEVAPEAPEFTAPDAANYEGVPGYFAHAQLKTGDQTQYGAQLVALLNALEKSDGAYDATVHAQAFRDHFGYGGTYIGYIDLATRESLNNHVRAEDEALRRAKAQPYDGSEMTTVAMVTKVMSLIDRLRGDELREAFKETVRITHGDNAEVMTHGLNVLDEIIATPQASGAYDQQLPAVSKLPALIAAQDFSGILGDAGAIAEVDAAVRTTNDHPHAIAHGRVVAAMMAASFSRGDVEDVLVAGRAAATPEIAALLDDALSRRDFDASEVTKHFGMACDLDYGVPSAVHNIATAPNYREAIRRNIYAGGDSAGRSIIIGAIIGALHGVGGERGIPLEWIDCLNSRPV